MIIVTAHSRTSQFPIGEARVGGVWEVAATAAWEDYKSSPALSLEGPAFLVHLQH